MGIASSLIEGRLLEAIPKAERGLASSDCAVKSRGARRLVVPTPGGYDRVGNYP